jgi:hypothetical protein
MAKPDQPEWRLSHYVNSLLERILLEPCWYTAVDTGTQVFKGTPQARMAWENGRRARGIKRAHLDWYAFQAPRFTQFELKYNHTRPDDNQAVTINLLTKRDIPTGTFCTILQVYAHLRDAGFRLHGNAANIAAEIDARWRAEDEAKRNGAPKPKRPAKPRPAKPSPSQVRRLTAIRSKVLF